MPVRREQRARGRHCRRQRVRRAGCVLARSQGACTLLSILACCSSSSQERGRAPGGRLIAGRAVRRRQIGKLAGVPGAQQDGKHSLNPLVRGRATTARRRCAPPLAARCLLLAALRRSRFQAAAVPLALTRSLLRLPHRSPSFPITSALRLQRRDAAYAPGPEQQEAAQWGHKIRRWLPCRGELIICMNHTRRKPLL